MKKKSLASRLLKRMKNATSITLSAGPPFVSMTYERERSKRVPPKIIRLNQTIVKQARPPRQVNPFQELLVRQMREKKEQAELQGNPMGAAGFALMESYIQNPRHFSKWLKDIEDTLS